MATTLLIQNFVLLFSVFCFPFVLIQTVIEKLTWKDRLPGYFMNISSILFMVSKDLFLVSTVVFFSACKVMNTFLDDVFRTNVYKLFFNIFPISFPWC